MRKPSLYIGKKNIVTFVLASAILIYGMVSSIDGLMYFFSEDKPIDMNTALELDNDAFSNVKDGDYVQVKGITSIQGGSLQKGMWGEKHIVFYLTGSPKFIIIEKVEEDENRGPENRTIKGRAHLFKTDGQAERMRKFFLNTFLIEIDEDGMMIESGNIPGTNYWPLILMAALIILMGLNIYLLVKPMKTEKEMENEIDEL